MEANGEAALTPRRDERSQEAVHRWILTQGYGVEHRAASLFGNHRFQARQGLTYRDVARDKIRDVDVVATAAFLEETGVEVHVVIECKRSPKAWITRTSGLLPTKGNLAWLPIATESVREYLSQDRRPLSELPLTRPFAFDVIETHQEKKETNPAFEAMTQVVAAARGLRASHAQFPNPALFHPVVVLDGSLYRVSFDGPQDADVVEIPRERVYWSGAQGLDAPVLVDVVTLAALPDYVAQLQDEVKELARELGRAKRDFAPDNAPAEPLAEWA